MKHLFSTRVFINGLQSMHFRVCISTFLQCHKFFCLFLIFHPTVQGVHAAPNRISHKTVCLQLCLLEDLCRKQVLPWKIHMFLTHASQETYQFLLVSAVYWRSCFQLVQAPCIYPPTPNVKRTNCFVCNNWDGDACFAIFTIIFMLCIPNNVWLMFIVQDQRLVHLNAKVITVILAYDTWCP